MRIIGVVALLSVFLSLQVFADGARIDVEEVKNFAATAHQMSDDHGRVTPELQAYIQIYDDVFGTRMTPEARDLFQRVVGQVGGRLHSRIEMTWETNSFWLEDLSRLHDFQSSPRVPDDVMDLTIVGAGLTGLGAAYAALPYIQKGYRVAVLDMGGVGEGASSRNGGITQPSSDNFIGTNEGLEKERFKRITELYPQLDERTRHRLAQVEAETIMGIGRGNANLFHAIASRGNLAADIDLGGMVRVPTTKADEAGLIADVQLAHRLGMKSEIWNPGRLFKETGIISNLKARYSPGYGPYHPYKFVTGGFEMLIAQNLLMFSQTPVEFVDMSTAPGQPIVLHTPRGNLRTRKMVLATDAYTSQLIPILSMVHAYQSQVVTFEHVLNRLMNRSLVGFHGDDYGAVPGMTRYIGENGLPFGMHLRGGGPDRFVADPFNLELAEEPFRFILMEAWKRFNIHGQPPSRHFTGTFAFTPPRLPILGALYHDLMWDDRIQMWVGTQGYGGTFALMGGYLAALGALLPPNLRANLFQRYDPLQIFSQDRYVLEPADYCQLVLSRLGN